MVDSRIKLYITSYSEEVTGSNNHVKVEWPDGREVSFLVDCGLFQEEQHKSRNIEKFPFNPKNISFALATHVHTDHVGRFPYLARLGFTGKIYTSYETYVILPTVLSETCERLEDDYRKELSEYKRLKKLQIRNKKNAKGRGRKDKQRKLSAKKRYSNLLLSKKNNTLEYRLKLPELMYQKKHIDSLMKLVEAQALLEPFEPVPGIEITFYPNAHIAGAVITVCRIYDENDEIYLLFTGDLGMNNPVTNVETAISKEICDKIDIVVAESTYGCSEVSRDVLHERKKHMKVIKEVHDKKGTIMYLSNSLERPLRLGVDLKQMQQDDEMKDIMKDFKVYFDSTFGIKCLNKYVKLFGDDYLPENFTVIDRSTRESTVAEPGPKMIICTSPRFYQGSFVTYGKRMLENSRATLVFVAYVPDKVRNIINLPLNSEIEYMNERIKLRCKRYQFGYYSSHVTTEEMDKFLPLFKNASTLLFNHGADEAKSNFVERDKTQYNATHNLLYGRTVMIEKDGIKKYY